MITQDMQDIVSKLNSHFFYKSDHTDEWVFLELSEVMQGDCEDYSLFIAQGLSGSVAKFYYNLLIRKANLYYVMHGEAGHCILEYNGYFVDNNFRRWVSKSDMESVYDFKFRFPIPLIIAKFAITKVKGWLGL